MTGEYWLRLKELRVACNMTQAYVADQLGFHRTTVARHEDGTSQLTVGELFQYLELYGASHRDVFDQPDIDPGVHSKLTHGQLMSMLTNTMPFLRTEDLRAILIMASVLSRREVGPERRRASPQS